MTPIDDNGLRGLWHSGEAALAPLPLAEVKRRAARLADAIGKRNRREYAAIAFVVIVYAIFAVILPGPLLKIGSAAIIAGALFVGWQLSRRTSRADPAAEATDVRAYFRRRLVKEERMLADVGRWYLAPLIPGFALFVAGEAAAVKHPNPVGFALFAGFAVMIFLGIWWLNRRMAAKLRAQIERLDRASASHEGDLK